MSNPVNTSNTILNVSNPNVITVNQNTAPILIPSNLPKTVVQSEGTLNSSGNIKQSSTSPKNSQNQSTESTQKNQVLILDTPSISKVDNTSSSASSQNGNFNSSIEN